MEQENINITPFLDEQGRVKQLPVKMKKLMPVLQYACTKLETGSTYTEKQINEQIKAFTTLDALEMRRALIDSGYLLRTMNGASYWLSENIPQEWMMIKPRPASNGNEAQ